MTAHIELIGRMETLALKPGDLLVVHTQEKLSYDQTAMLRHYVEARVPGHKVLVMAGGLELGVVREEATAA